MRRSMIMSLFGALALATATRAEATPYADTGDTGDTTAGDETGDTGDTYFPDYDYLGYPWYCWEFADYSDGLPFYYWPLYFLNCPGAGPIPNQPGNGEDTYFIAESGGFVAEDTDLTTGADTYEIVPETDVVTAADTDAVVAPDTDIVAPAADTDDTDGYWPTYDEGNLPWYCSAYQDYTDGLPVYYWPLFYLYCPDAGPIPTDTDIPAEWNDTAWSDGPIHTPDTDDVDSASDDTYYTGPIADTDEVSTDTYEIVPIDTDSYAPSTPVDTDADTDGDIAIDPPEGWDYDLDGDTDGSISYDTDAAIDTDVPVSQDTDIDIDIDTDLNFDTDVSWDTAATDDQIPATCVGDVASGDSDADGVCDSDDLCEGDDASGDSDFDALCDDTDFVMDASGIVRGNRSAFTIDHALPGSDVFVIASLQGPGPGPCLQPSNVCASIRAPFVVARGTADAYGSANLWLQVPRRGVTQVPVALQAVWADVSSGEANTSNVVYRMIRR